MAKNPRGRKFSIFREDSAPLENQCKNNGQCIPNDDYMITNPKFACICPKGFTGDRCE
jgi:hypothetical protein